MNPPSRLGDFTGTLFTARSAATIRQIALAVGRAVVGAWFVSVVVNIGAIVVPLLIETVVGIVRDLGGAS
jgi:hypothetical protein